MTTDNTCRLRCYFTVIHSVRHQNAITCAPSSWVLTLAPVVCRDGGIDAGTRVCCVDRAIALSVHGHHRHQAEQSEIWNEWGWAGLVVWQCECVNYKPVLAPCLLAPRYQLLLVRLIDRTVSTFLLTPPPPATSTLQSVSFLLHWDPSWSFWSLKPNQMWSRWSILSFISCFFNEFTQALNWNHPFLMRPNKGGLLKSTLRNWLGFYHQ